MKDDEKAARKRDALQRIAVVEEILRRWNPIGQSVPADRDIAIEILRALRAGAGPT